MMARSRAASLAIEQAWSSQAPLHHCKQHGAQHGAQAIGIAVADIKALSHRHQKVMGSRTVSETSGVSRVRPAPTETFSEVRGVSR